MRRGDLRTRWKEVVTRTLVPDRARAIVDTTGAIRSGDRGARARATTPRLEEGRMKRSLAMLAGIVLLASVGTAASAQVPGQVSTRAGKAENYGSRLVCGEGSPLCAEANDALGYNGGYTGHDEPSLLFYSGAPGSGNDSNYRWSFPRIRRSCRSRTARVARSTSRTGSRSGSAWICATTSRHRSSRTTRACRTATRTSSTAPTRRKPTTSATIPGRRSWSCSSTRRAGCRSRTPSAATPRKWCAAMAIFSFNSDQNTGVANNADCLNTVGIEPANFAFITRRRRAARARRLRSDLTLGDVHAQPGHGPVHEPGRSARHLDPRLDGRAGRP